MYTGRTDDRTFAIQYMQMQRNSLEPSDSLYSLSSGSLPTHIRSISPKMDVRGTMEREQTKTSRCSTRFVYVILVAIFVISSSVAVAVAVHEIRKIQAAGRLQEFIQMHPVGTTTEIASMSTTSHIKNAGAMERTTLRPLYSDQPTDQRTQCYKQCTMYGDTKFISTCIAGYCECNGEHYQRKSCLPRMQGCHIEKQSFSKQAFLWNAAATVFSCTNRLKADFKTKDDQKRIFIVSIHGNHFEKYTQLHLTNTTSRNDSIIVVLASHYPVRWLLHQQNTSISGIILLSDRELSASQVEVTSQDGVMKPEVKHMFTEVGFGDDRHSHTVEMIQAVTKNVGPITKFLGSDYADNIFLDVAD